MIAGMYAAGHGVPQDTAESLAWLQKAADHGNDFAQSSLGTVYASGIGVQRDNIQAYKWFSLAMLRSRDRVRDLQASQRATVASKMTPEQVEQAEELVRSWRATPASNPPSTK
jgi:uncharacterized protein